MAQDVLSIISKLSIKSKEILHLYEKKHDAFFTEMKNALPKLIELLDVDELSVSTQPSTIEADYIHRQKSTIRTKNADSQKSEKEEANGELSCNTSDDAKQQIVNTPVCGILKDNIVSSKAYKGKKSVLFRKGPSTSTDEKSPPSSSNKKVIVANKSPSLSGDERRFPSNNSGSYLLQVKKWPASKTGNEMSTPVTRSALVRALAPSKESRTFSHVKKGEKSALFPKGTSSTSPDAKSSSLSGDERVISVSNAGNSLPRNKKSRTPKSGNEKSTPGTRSGSVKILVSSKASKHRSRLSRSATRKEPTSKIAAKMSYVEKKLTAVNSAQSSRLQSVIQDKCTQEQDEAIAKKAAILKAKVEEQKKRRELKAEKNLQARQQMEKEKEERLKKLEKEKRKQEKLEEKKKSELKKLHQQVELNKKRKLFGQSDAEDSGPSDHVKKTTKVCVEEQENAPHSEQNLNSTFVLNCPKKAENATVVTVNKDASYSNYDISELRNSDSEDDVEPTKPVPKWASGLRLKEALLKQFYNLPSTRNIFGKIYIAPDEMFGVKKTNVLRTSSAIWGTPDQTFTQY